MVRLCPLSIAAMILVGCGNDSNVGLYPDSGGSMETDADVEIPATGEGLPCELRATLADHCQTCHGAKPSNGAPFPLVTYQDLSRKNGDGVVIAARVLERIKSTTRPMPPSPASPLTAAEIAAFESWTAQGAPVSAVDCKAMPGPFDGPVVCTSGMRWPGGNNGNQIMHPGMACISCHLRDDDDASVIAKDDAPQFRIAGTVYPTGHEPNDCNGAMTGVVEVTDSAGVVTRLPVNSVGNFFTTKVIAMPFHVAVVANGKRRAMVMSPPVGDCNSCHTQDGRMGAPGRITLP
jgi:mono/diheme cytochrome c family protein